MSALASVLALHRPHTCTRLVRVFGELEVSSLTQYLTLLRALGRVRSRYIDICWGKEIRSALAKYHEHRDHLRVSVAGASL